MNKYVYDQLKRVFDLQHDKLLLRLDKRYYDDTYCPLGKIECEKKKVKLEEFDCKLQLLELEIKEVEETLLQIKNKK
jgi:hypothetical protein